MMLMSTQVQISALHVIFIIPVANDHEILTWKHLFFLLQSTSGGEPRTLLNALKPMLGSLGDIKTPQEVVRVVRYIVAW